jgi:hypothetical protein
MFFWNSSPKQGEEFFVYNKIKRLNMFFWNSNPKQSEECNKYLSNPALFFAKDSARQLANILPSASDQERIDLFQSYTKSITENISHKNISYKVAFYRNKDVFDLLLDNLPENKGNLVEKLFYKEDGSLNHEKNNILHILTEIGDKERLGKVIELIPEEKKWEIYIIKNESDKKNIFNLALYYDQKESMKIILNSLSSETRKFFVSQLYDEKHLRNGINLAYDNGRSSKIFQVVLDSLENDETKIELLLDEGSTPLKYIIRDMDYNTYLAKKTQDPDIIKDLARKLKKFHILFDSIENKDQNLLKEAVAYIKEPELFSEIKKHLSVDMPTELNEEKYKDITDLINSAPKIKEEKNR